MSRFDGTVMLRSVTGIRQFADSVRLDIEALPAVTVEPLPGWITGEPLDQQGIETTMPNLPDLDLPDLTPQQFTLRVSAPALDTVRITIARADDRVLDDDGTWLGIVTDPAPDAARLRVDRTDDEIKLSTAALTVCIGLRSFRLRVTDADGRLVLRTSEFLRQVAGFPMAPAVIADDAGITMNLEIGPDEHILGLGEQFGPVVKNGQRLVLSVQDALGTGTGMAYKPVPVWHSTRGCTGFLNTGTQMTVDVGHSRPSVLSLTVPDSAIDLYLVVGADPKLRLTSYTALTGRSHVPDAWAFGYWMGRCRYHSSAEMLAVADLLRDHEIPCDVLHLDPDWLVVDRLNTDFIWNHERFGDRRSFVAELAARDLRLSLWELPYLDPLSPRYAEAESRGFLLTDAAGEPVGIQKTPTPDGRPRAIVDFFDPAAVRWWQDLHRDFLADGVAVFKTDFGEAVPDTVLPSNGLPPAHAHNLFTLRYNGAVSDVLAEVTGNRSLVWGRSGWAGSQRYPGQWGGDAESTVVGMQSTLRGGLSYALSAPGLWSHDIGGFFGSELTPALYARWTQFGALSPLMRAHGLRPREPWEFGRQVLQIARDWIRLRYSLLPYLWQVAHESTHHGWPMLRPLTLEYPDDLVARHIDGQFMLGADLLVAPIFSDAPEPVEHPVYLPPGRWSDLITGQRFTGPGYVTMTVPLASMPVLVRDGAVIPRIDLPGVVRSTDQLLALPWTLHSYGAVPDSVRLVGFDRTTTTVQLAGGPVIDGGPGICPVLVRHD